MSTYETQLTVDSLTGDEIITVGEEATLLDVAMTLAGADIGAVVVGSPVSAVGVVSERDVVRAVADGKDLAATPAMSVASESLVWADVSTTVADVAEQMMEKWVRHVLVEQGGRLVGIVSARDLLGVYASSDSFSTETAD